VSSDDSPVTATAYVVWPESGYARQACGSRGPSGDELVPEDFLSPPSEGASSESPYDRAAARVGSQVRGTWRLDGLLGMGGMAAVYAATHRYGSRAALKILHIEMAGDHELRERFLREGDVAKRVDHPGCVRILDDDVTEQGEPFLIIELLEGHTLEDLWRDCDGQLTTVQALPVAASVLDTLAAFHAQRIVHRDVKPSNIFLTDDSGVKILDFGVAQLREPGRDMTRAGTAMGTAAYMAPEQALGMSEQVDSRADIYGVGATLYSILSGERLHRGSSEQESYVLAATQPAPSIARAAPHLPLEVITVVDKALQWDRRNRYQTADEMRQAIEALQAFPQSSPSRKPPVEEGRVELDLDLDPQGGASGGAIELADDGPEVPRHGDLPIAGAVGVDLDIELNLGDLTEFSPELDLETTAERQPVVARPGGLPSGTSAPAKQPTATTPSVEALSLETPSPRPPLAQPQSRSDGAPTSTSHRAAQPAATGDVRVAPSHPLASLFLCVDRLLRTARQYGPAHPETQNRLAPVFDAMTEALRANGAGVHWKVLPYCFTQGDETLWEPSPPGDIVPYTLSVAGLKEVHVTSGVTEDELRELFGAMMIDGKSDPSEIATALWEAPFQHVECRLEEELGGDDAESLDEFLADTADMEAQLRERLSDVQRMALAMQREDVMEAAAMAAMTDAAADTAATLQLDEATRQALSAALSLDSEEVRERHHRVLIDAFVDGAERRDIPTLATAVAAYANRLVRLGRSDELFATHRALVAHVQENRGRTSRLSLGDLTAALYPPEVLVHVARMASGWGELLDAEQSDRAMSGFQLVAETLDSDAMPLFLQLADKLREGPVFAQILDYIGRASVGEEEQVIGKLEAMNPLTTQLILARLLERGGERVKAMLQPLRTSPNTALRCEAIAQLAESQIGLTDELMKLFQSDDKSVRWAALDTFVRHRVVSAGPGLVRLVDDGQFKERALDEQQKVLEALHALHPPRTEALLSSLVSKHGLVPNEALEQTRMLAARMLGEWAETEGALKALQGAARRRPWNSAPLREVSEHAARAVQARGHGGPAATGASQ
jgi:serine/threonine protein kinase